MFELVSVSLSLSLSLVCVCVCVFWKHNSVVIGLISSPCTSSEVLGFPVLGAYGVCWTHAALPVSSN